MINVRNTGSRVVDINCKKTGGDVITLLPGLNAIDDNAWALAIQLKWTRKQVDRGIIEGPDSVGDVKMWAPAKAPAKAPKKSGKSAETFG